MNQDEKNSIYYTTALVAIMVLVLINSCAHKKTIKDRDSVAVNVPTPTPSVNATPSITPVVGGVTFKADEYSLDWEKKKITEASKKYNEVVNSDCFKSFMMKREMVQTQGLTNEQVINKIRSFSGTIIVHFYYKRFTSEVAVRYPPSKDINFNRKFWYEATPTCEFASTLGHEGSHALGEFEHDFQRTDRRDFSVPYSINSAFNACCK